MTQLEHTLRARIRDAREAHELCGAESTREALAHAEDALDYGGEREADHRDRRQDLRRANACRA